MITSESNKKIKELIKLKENKNIKKYKKYLIEGTHLVEEALKKGIVEEIIVEENYKDDRNLLKKSNSHSIVSKKIIKLFTDTVTNQGIVAVCKIEEKQLNIVDYNKVLILDRIQDPGNLGTIIRTADAFNFDCVVLGENTTSLYGSKVMRSMQGSNFHLDCYENIKLLSLIDEMKDFNIYATSLKGDKYLEEIDNFSSKVAVVLGNEGQGVAPEILEKVDNLLKISMPGAAESLNVAISAGIILHYITIKTK